MMVWSTRSSWPAKNHNFSELWEFYLLYRNFNLTFYFFIFMLSRTLPFLWRKEIVLDCVVCCQPVLWHSSSSMPVSVSPIPLDLPLHLICSLNASFYQIATYTFVSIFNVSILMCELPVLGGRRTWCSVLAIAYSCVASNKLFFWGGNFHICELCLFWQWLVDA